MVQRFWYIFSPVSSISLSILQYGETTRLFVSSFGATHCHWLPNSLCNQIQTTVSRFIITGVLGISASGLYAAASKIPNLLNVLQQIVQQAWQLSAFQEFKSSGLKHFYDVIWRVYHALMSVGSALVNHTLSVHR